MCFFILNKLTQVISGGVAANQYIRKELAVLTKVYNYNLVCPPVHLCTDNGVMIAWAGVENYIVGKGFVEHPEFLKSIPKWSLDPSVTNHFPSELKSSVKFEQQSPTELKLAIQKCREAIDSKQKNIKTKIFKRAIQAALELGRSHDAVTLCEAAILHNPRNEYFTKLCATLKDCTRDK
eukprot:TRINITY_DN2035_c0_g1_i7.p1 TRINITY_DN2035_c0_g1~~TRINITY_DN2035_c0_g1_i7.p1  ORF type:complete len:179 (+),score=22.44 TRINITY_DN2035_c0_g1_i7:486-1022(+)